MCAIFDFWWNNFLMGMKFNFKFEIWENFYKGFPCKKKITWEFLVKWTKIRIQWDSFVKFSVGGSRSISRGIPYKIEEEKFYKGFPCEKKIIRELFVIWSQIKSKANSHIKSCKKKLQGKLHIKCTRIIFKRISSMFFSKRSEFCFSMRIVCKMNPDKI